MRPLTLKLNNFGPFLNETINFDNINENQLFLISGKTGSGKTMIFDAMVYALFGEASTKDRQEGDLRSHFADGKLPMSVEFEFKLRESIFKIVRQGAFIKEGNKNKTLGQLAIYQLENDEFTLRESKITQGNHYLESILGVNAEQFRQLFILPQGEFKRFLLSKSKEKQSILRTLFNSERFENIQKRLNDDVSEVRNIIEQRYNTLENNWQDINTFEDDELSQYKEISTRQTSRLSEILDVFRDKGKVILQELKSKKEKQDIVTKKLKDKLETNIKLENDLAILKNKQKELEILKENEPEINRKVQFLKELNEVKPLLNLIETQEGLHSKKANIESDIAEKEILLDKINKSVVDFENQLSNYNENQQAIDSKRKFVEKCNLFFEKKEKYQKAYNQFTNSKEKLNQISKQFEMQQSEVEEIKKQLNQRKPNYSKLDEVTASIFELNMKIKELKSNELNKVEYNQLLDKKSNVTNKLKGVKEAFQLLEKKYQDIDKSNIDLKDKQNIIATIQAALQKGDTCPVCGHEIDVLDEHLDFDEITFRHKQLTEIEQEKNKQNEIRINLESDLRAIEEQIGKFDTDKLKQTNYELFEQELSDKEKEKQSISEENKQIENLLEQLNKKQSDLHRLELEQNKIEHQVKTDEVAINDFESTTAYQSVETFVSDYQRMMHEIEAFDKRIYQLENNIQNDKNKISVEKNSIQYLQNSLDELINEARLLSLKIDEEMSNLGFSTINEVQEIVAKISDKEQLEDEITKYNKDKQAIELAIAQYIEQTQDRVLEDIPTIREQSKLEQLNYENIASELSKHEYKMEFNQKKINEIIETIDQLEEELKEQQEIFQLSEILSGQNNLKLTLENYVLIYYLERILTQANQRLALMTGQRYQLSRRQQVSKGYSGLEIEVFDTHSNQTRHITSLSGGETFQASLALALGLSEVVQEESGGITLESMFVDEGFGTLDQETLETALDTLMSLKSTGRMVGIISHVSELKQRIPLILEIQSDSYQSTTNFKRQ
ncbi:SMC family ATPase [Staphylococcus sp. ACRSN]|uniref:exonuclease subunit SbcC n=1 Tax=Staphylococcus sp. ACRSN TaxID=2918214 RepID=UPI001EF286ED|nr:exonuclease subunit SbcC [Staphylococcus sp. ACRSN]MCG7339543.1 SMC family ATPase [Staphylococcus sp. ACRSN]